MKLTDDRCIIPAECLKQAGVSLRIGVSGVKGGEQKDTVWCLTSRIMYAVDAAQLVPPSHSGADIRLRFWKSSGRTRLRTRKWMRPWTMRSHPTGRPRTTRSIRGIRPPTKKWRTFLTMFSATSVNKYI